MMIRLSRFLDRQLRQVVPSLIALIVFGSSVFARSGPVYNHPIYSPYTKSYFELVVVEPEQRRLSIRNAQEVSWEVAAKLAGGRTFRGAKGRLAVVPDLKVHEFLLENFRPENYAWIGAAYYCKTRQLRWSDGRLQKRRDFRAWHPRWDQAGEAGCMKGGGEGPFMPIAYTSVSEGFRWVAKGAHKEYSSYFVEYTTGEP